ncbi:efflux RND transporter periplasmic adaptor subunit [Shewanella surugensis]|uniref:Efflux RND transporter periplasmic adaptor subunit n=1 Tax=Shewanella surugensis TaxID=212020 RepID=A0ABT0LBB2_9GAMM|nr:efflux RND transporter periplasmic adaptor subunit [Shewanella surugensis]MCL1124996.1 efflux RND transporter periplasmic adaptor subunit [Shewanella surugensis]
MTRIDGTVSSYKRNIIITIIILTVVVVSLYFIKSILVDKKQQASLKTSLPVSVIIDKVKIQLWGTELFAVGTVQSFEGITVKAQMTGRITQMVGQSGTQIKQGDLLFQINPEVLKAELAEAEAKLESSQFEYQRLQQLYKKGAVSEEKLIQAKSQYHNDESALATTGQKLALASNIAEFDGVLGLTQVEVGDEVTIGDVLATLQSQTRLRVEFSVPQKYRTRIRVGDDVNVMRELIYQAELGERVPNFNTVPHYYVAKVYLITHKAQPCLNTSVA